MNGLVSKKEIKCFAAFLCGVLALFMGDMLLAGNGYFHGDYKQQYYPWASYLSAHIRHFSLPLWAPEMGCGFPLLAEGQIGAFYPLNWLLCLVFPFPLSYHLSFPLLFLMAGFFTYLFVRRAGLEPLGAALAVAVFLFGSSYAGFFDGLVSFRSLLWFPPALFFTDRIVAEGKWRDAGLLALCFCFGIFGGHAQMACYSMGAVSLYFIAKNLFLMPKGSPRHWRPFLTAFVLGFCLAACQVLPTWELVSQTSRAQASLDFALAKSMNPLSVATVFWPGFGAFFGGDFYVGVLPICLAFFAISRRDRDKTAIFWMGFGLFFIFLAFGRHNPFYVLFLKLFPLNFFRLPFKFLFFSSFAFSIVAGKGLDRLLFDRERARFFKKAVLLGIIAFALYVTAHFVARQLEAKIMEWAYSYLQAHVYQKPGHPYSWEEYLTRLTQMFAVLKERTAFGEPNFLWNAVLWLAAIGFGFWHASRYKIVPGRIVVGAVFLLTLLDLFHYMDLGTGFRGNRLKAEAVAGDGITDYLSERTDGPYRSYEVIAEGENPHPFWMPDSNLLFGYPSVGLYSPLALDSYRELLRGVGDVDNSTGFYLTNKLKIKENLPLLDLLGARYIISRLDLSDLEGISKILDSRRGDSLYENKNAAPRAFLTSKTKIDETGKTAIVEAVGAKEEGVRWDKNTPTRKTLTISAPPASFLFLSDVFYPGWKAKVDGRTETIFKANGVFQGLPLATGVHTVELVYEPRSLALGAAISFASLIAVLFLIWGLPKAVVRR